MMYSCGDSTWLTRGVYVVESGILERKFELWWPFSCKTTPFDEERQMMNWNLELSWAEICEAIDICVLPRPNIPFAPLGMPFNKNMGAQEKRML